MVKVVSRELENVLVEQYQSQGLKIVTQNYVGSINVR